jgi:hypothetical protein
MNKDPKKLLICSLRSSFKNCNAGFLGDKSFFNTVCYICSCSFEMARRMIKTNNNQHDYLRLCHSLKISSASQKLAAIYVALPDLFQIIACYN